MFSVFETVAQPVHKFPEATITNGLIKARLYLPDTEKGYYRAPGLIGVE